METTTIGMVEANHQQRDLIPQTESETYPSLSSLDPRHQPIVRHVEYCQGRHTAARVRSHSLSPKQKDPRQQVH